MVVFSDVARGDFRQRVGVGRVSIWRVRLLGARHYEGGSFRTMLIWGCELALVEGSIGIYIYIVFY